MIKGVARTVHGCLYSQGFERQIFNFNFVPRNVSLFFEKLLDRRDSREILIHVSFWHFELHEFILSLSHRQPPRNYVTGKTTTTRVLREPLMMHP